MQWSAAIGARTHLAPEDRIAAHVADRARRGVRSTADIDVLLAEC
jgi:hypothetical protein